MPTDRLQQKLDQWLSDRRAAGALKGSEHVITNRQPARGKNGPRFELEGFGSRQFIRMNANDYLGMAFQMPVHQADDVALARYGTGPGAVRFISGTWAPHLALEKRLADFHTRDATMIFSSAYATVMGVLPALIDDRTVVLSDELNHNSIINAIRLAQPIDKFVYPHLDMDALAALLAQTSGSHSSAVIVTDGVFSMRGDHAPLDRIMMLASQYDKAFADNVIVVVDDSHGVGAYGRTGRGTEQVCAAQADVLIGTLGKAIGVNGGYVAASNTLIEYLREVSPFYIYSNPIGPGEAAAAHAAVDLLDSDDGLRRLKCLDQLTRRLKQGLNEQGYATVPGEHPVIALLVGDTPRMHKMIDCLFAGGVLATGLGFPVVPADQEEIRFQICADHTQADIDHVLSVLGPAKNWLS